MREPDHQFSPKAPALFTQFHMRITRRQVVHRAKSFVFTTYMKIKNRLRGAR